MAKSQKIVVPTDFSKGSEAALDWVKRLKELGDTEVHCVNVVQEPLMYMPAMAGAAVATMPTTGELQDAAGDALKDFVASKLPELKGSVVTKVLVGHPAQEITDYAKAIDADMIVIATRGQSGLARVMLGSTAEGVVRHAECSVLTVRS